MEIHGTGAVSAAYVQAAQVEAGQQMTIRGFDKVLGSTVSAAQTLGRSPLSTLIRRRAKRVAVPVAVDLPRVRRRGRPALRG